ncbi:ComEC/Rec2 family competence protein [Roseobacteraceae bacterium NS-SX3]
MRVLAATDRLLQSQRGHLFPWVPVCFAAGIGGYFALPAEPGAAVLAGAAAAGAAALLLVRLPNALAFAGWALALAAAGFCLAAGRAHWVAAPVLDYRYYGPVEGRVAALDRSAAGALRVTLDQVRLGRLSPLRTPEKVRLSLPGANQVPVPGTRVMTTAHLLPPQGPAEPGGFDFRRYAWFQGLGAVGYSRVPLLAIAPPGDALPVQQLRTRVSELLQQRLPGEAGAFAAAVTTGDRSGVGQGTLQALRASNLAHLLAISGLHMGLLSGFVFAAVRLGLCLLTAVALRWPVKKLAAGAALAVAAAYLALSGGNVATERAFIMVAVMLCAVLLDRRALSLRAVAVAAVIVLIRRPESLLSPGFQMSFAATTALVAVFGLLRDAQVPLGPRWLRPAAAVVISSAVAGVATAPFGAAHFNTLAHYGLAANLLAVPVMGTVVIPAAVLVLCLAPVELEGAGLTAMRWGLEWILSVAHWVAEAEGAQGHVAAPGPWVLPVLGLGALVLLLWQGRGRLAGLAPVALALCLWMAAERPPVLIAGNGGLVGVVAAEGRALSRAKGQGFAARVWLENDGDGAAQPDAAARWPGEPARLKRMEAGGQSVVHVIGKRAAENYSDCPAGVIVVATVPMTLNGQCTLLDPPRLKSLGSVMLTAGGRMRSANALAGDRLWTRAQQQRPRSGRKPAARAATLPTGQ